MKLTQGISTLKDIYALVFPKKTTRQYIKLIKKSQLFNKKYYHRNTPLSFLRKIMPIRHFVLFGEKQNARPTYYFCPQTYQKKYLTPQHLDIAPFLHYLTIGKQQEYNCALDYQHFHYPDLTPMLFGQPQAIAIVLHIHYPDLWIELRSYLSRCDYAYDLFCTLSIPNSESQNALIKQIQAFKPNARCIPVPNHGRDIFPFIYLINHDLLDSYALIMKIHTKKSPHKMNGNSWRKQLLEPLFPPLVGKPLLDQLISNDSWVGAVAPNQIISNERFWSNNKPKVMSLLKKLSMDIADPVLKFPAGSMYFVKQPIIQALKQLDLTYTDFEIEDSQLDNTTAHAVERIIGIIAHGLNKEFIEITSILN